MQVRTKTGHLLYCAVTAVGLTLGATPRAVLADDPPAAKQVDAPSPDQAHCRAADRLLRAGKFKEAAVEAAAVAEGPSRAQAAYQLGYASFALKDYATAVRSLSTLAPFDQPGIGLHAQYLLARVHHLSNERPEAMAGYQGLIASWERQRKETPHEPAPNYVARAEFYWGVIQCEFGQPDEALTKFMAAAQLASSSSPIAPLARLHGAAAAVQVKKYQDAVTLVTPLRDDPRHGVEALRYLAKAQYGLGTTPVPKGRGEAAIMNAVADPAALAAGIKEAVATLRTADERARALPGSGEMRARVLLDLGDVLQLDRQFKEAATAYGEAATARAADVVEPATARQAMALQLSGDYAAADRICDAFLARYPKSDLRAEVSERYAENALLAAYAKRDPAAATTAAATATGEASARNYQDAVARFTRVIEKYPETTQASLARLGLASVHYLGGEFAEAEKLLTKIPESERVDDLIGVGFLLADCQLRGLPATADDALTSARVAAQLEQVTTQLDAFVGTRPNTPEAAEALVRVGYASGRLAGMLADPVEKRRALAKARRAYMAVLQEYPDHPLYPVALLENAKLLAQVNGAPAVMELSKFQAPPLNQSKLAPLAMIHLADAQRTRRHPDESIRLLTDVRAKYEAELSKDPKRAAWVPALRYSLALSLKEAGKYEEAAAEFGRIAAEFPDRPEAADVAWRVAQCQTEPALVEVEGGHKALMAAGKPAMQQELLATLLESTKKLRAAAEAMGKAAETTAAKGDDASTELATKMNYDSAWCWKVVGEVEVETVRRGLQAEALRRATERQQAAIAAAAKEKPRRKAPLVKPAEVAIGAVALQPGERLARERFKAVADGGGDSPLADEARTQLVELYAQRDEADAAIAVVKEMLEKAAAAGATTPGAGDQVERLQLRLGTLYLAKGDAKSAAQAAAGVLGSQRTAYVSYARAIAAEAAYRQGDWAETVAQARTFLDNPRGNGRIPGVSDHAVLRMAEAQGRMGKWADARATLETWLGRFGSGQLGPEGKFAYGWVNENLGETAKAIAAYTEAARGGGELAARANERVERLRASDKAAVADKAGGGGGAKDDGPTAVLQPRIPNLLVVKANRSGPTLTNPGVTPAAAITTAAVSNVDGGSALPLLAPMARGIAVEIAPLPAVLAFDRAPELQAEGVRDDGDAPAWAAGK